MVSFLRTLIYNVMTLLDSNGDMSHGVCRDPCGFLCVLIVWASMVYGDYVVIAWLVLPTFPER